MSVREVEKVLVEEEEEEPIMGTGSNPAVVT